MLRLGVLVSGSGTTLQAIIDSIKSGYLKAEVASVISSKKSAYAIERAIKNNIEYEFISIKNFESEIEYGNALINNFSRKNVELVIAAGFLTKLPSNFIKYYDSKIMNVHPSLIPAFCGEGFYGIKVHEEVLRKGAKVTGATVHFIDEVYDNGPIILQKAVNVFECDTPETLQRRVMEEAERPLYVEAIKLFSEKRLRVREGKVFIMGD